MKKFRKYAGIYIGILIFILFTVPVWGRAGGGTGGSSGGSSSGYVSSGNTGNSAQSRRSPLATVIQIIVIGAAAGGGTIVFTMKARKAAIRSRKLMKQYEILGGNWNYQEIQKQVEEAYFQIQECWRRMDAGYAAAYLSKEMMDDFSMKIQWMKVRNEKVVQKHVRLLSAVPVSTHDEPGEENDSIWYLIHGTMTGYYIDGATGRCVRGNTQKEAFYEYWKFVYRNRRWVLREIRQKDEMDIEQFV